MPRTCIKCRVGYNAHLSEEWPRCPRCGGGLSDVSLADLGPPGSASVTGSPVECHKLDDRTEPQVGDVEAYLAMVERARGTASSGND